MKKSIAMEAVLEIGPLTLTRASLQRRLRIIEIAESLNRGISQLRP
jgi:hypothetical protein